MLYLVNNKRNVQYDYKNIIVHIQEDNRFWWGDQKSMKMFR